MNDPQTPPATELTEQLHKLEALGTELVRNGQHREAERIFLELVKSAPRHAPALQYLATRALNRNALEEAQAFIERAIHATPRAAVLHQNLGIVLRARGYPEGALLALDAALKLRPGLTMSWIQRGDVLQALGRDVEALAMYRQAEHLGGDLLALALAGEDTPRNRRQLLTAAHYLAQARMTAVHGAPVPLKREDPTQAPDRIETAIRHMCRAATADYADPLQRPAYAYVPGLEAHPFFERGAFPFLTVLEQNVEAIRDELHTVLAEQKGIVPRVRESAERAGPMSALNHSEKWSAYPLYRNGERIADHGARCPRTLAAMESLPLVKMPGLSPDIFFSILQPHTQIPPHYGLGNYKLSVHLPLEITSDCAIRIGGETRHPTLGKCLIFDDSFEHDAWNPGDTLQATLVLEIWHPDLGESEREKLSSAQTALERFAREMTTLAKESLSSGHAPAGG